MKGKDTMRTLGSLIALLLLVLTGGLARAADKSPMVMFQEALYQEETEGDLDKAIELYQQVLEEAAEVERIAARTTYQLGMCHLKKGDETAAAKYFRQVVKKYPKQTSASKKAQAQLDKITPSAPGPQDMLPADILSHIIEKHFLTGKKANELGIPSNTHIYGVDGMKKISGGLLDVFNMGNDTWIEKRSIGTFTPNNKDLMLYNEQYQEQVFEWKDIELARGIRSELIWTPDRPVKPGEFRVLGYLHNGNPKLARTSDGYVIKMQNDFGSEVIENFFLVLPSTIKIVNKSHEITSHWQVKDVEVYQFERHMKGENNIVTVTLDYLDRTTPNSPIVIKTEPGNLTNNVSPETTEITVTFNKEMVPHSYSWCRNQHPYPETTGGRPVFSNGNFSCTLSVKLEPGQYYRIGINTPPYQSFKSIDGDPAHHYVLVFATADENGKPTKIPPSIIEEAKQTNHRFVTPDELKAIVEKAVLTISTCTETDPKVKESLDSLKGIQEGAIVAELSTYLDSETANIRRSAIYIVWRGEFLDISAAEPKLLELLDHQENFTRGMAAIALGANKVAKTYEPIAKMTLEDKDGYARRCGAYALGLLGDPKALPVLEQALSDHEDFVKTNAQAAIAMLTKLNDEKSDASELEPTITQEMHNDIQPDGTIRFKNPQWVVNDGDEPITERRFINSDFVKLTKMTDEQGNPVEFTAKHEGSIYRYHVIFDPPVMPGETVSYASEGTMNGLIKPVSNMKDTYRYHMTHSPASGVPTLRIEEYVLPEGAELLSTLSDMQQSDKDGRILLRVEKVIPPGGNLTTSFKYRLSMSEPDPLKAEDLVAEGWRLWGQRKPAEAEAKFKEAVENDPVNDGAYQGLGWAQLNQGKKKNAAVSFKKCVKLNPENSAALNGLGWIEHDQGNFDMAIKWWEKAVKASNGTATASLSGLTQVYMDREEYGKAVKYYEMWLKAEPNNRDAKDGLEKARQAMK